MDKKNIDLVLIDDDKLMHMTWAYVAKERGLEIYISHLADTSIFQAIEKDTPIYLDNNIAGVSGIGLAIQLNQLGFTNISLATGSDLDPKQIPDFIREVRGKDFPEHLHK
jgi:hypothetical protein